MPKIIFRASTVNFFYTAFVYSCTDEYAHMYDISTYSVQQWSCELGLGSGLGLGLGLELGFGSSYVLLVCTLTIIYIHATCKRHVVKGFTGLSSIAIHVDTFWSRMTVKTTQAYSLIEYSDSMAFWSFLTKPRGVAQSFSCFANCSANAFGRRHSAARN